jgi:hypothetical protein
MVKDSAVAYADPVLAIALMVTPIVEDIPESDGWVTAMKV